MKGKEQLWNRNELLKTLPLDRTSWHPNTVLQVLHQESYKQKKKLQWEQ